MQTYQIPCGVGGIVKNSNLDDIDPRSLLIGQNVTIENGVFEKRPGTSKRNATAISGGPKVVGVYDFPKSTWDSFTKTMLHFNGVNNTGVFTDEIGKVYTAFGGLGLTTAQFKFGGASAFFDGTNDYLTTPDHADWAFGTGDFTIDFRVRFNASGGSYHLITAGTTGFYIKLDTNVLGFSFDGTAPPATAAWTPSLNTWYHVAITRSGGNSLKFFVDGVQKGTTYTGTQAVADSTGSLYIGAYADGAQAFFNGWLDELRISKGIARWTGDFTPPGDEYLPSLDGTRAFIACTSDGKIYNETAGPAFTTTIKTGLGTDKRYNFELFNAEVYICNGFDPVQIWNGASATTSGLTSPPGWSGNNQPTALIGHNNRLWGWLENIMYFSAINDGKNWSGTLAIGNKLGITGAKVVQGWIHVFKEDGSIYRINDDSVTVSNWYVEEIVDASNEGPIGLASQRLIIEAGNNAFFMSKTGRIYNLLQAIQSGDLRTADITENPQEKLWFYNWIRDNIDLTKLATDAHCVADAQRGIILWFCTKIGSSSPDVVLVYFYRKRQWFIWDNDSFASGVKAYSSCVRRLSDVDYVYTGDGAGFVWQLGETNRNDGGNGYMGKFQIPHVSLENPRETKQIRRVALTIELTGDYNLNMDTYVDSVAKETGRTFNLNTQDTNTRITAIGKRFGATFYNSTANENFRVGTILLDYQALGARP